MPIAKFTGTSPLATGTLTPSNANSTIYIFGGMGRTTNTVALIALPIIKYTNVEFKDTAGVATYDDYEDSPEVGGTVANMARATHDMKGSRFRKAIRKGQATTVSYNDGTGSGSGIASIYVWWDESGG